jgi:hypothetical protein
MKWGDPDVREYLWARREHAWRLRKERLTFAEIGKRLGVTKTRAQYLARAYSDRKRRYKLDSYWGSRWARTAP